jgi:DNA-directed RNA polymerase sigma subunit (sigma70/sigma32)
MTVDVLTVPSLEFESEAITEEEITVTRERIQQIEAEALRKMRHTSRSNKHRDYLEY